MIHQNVQQAHYLADLVDASPHMERMAPVALNVVAFRYVTPDAEPEVLDRLNQELLLRIQERGIAIPSSTVLRGRLVLRACICNHRSRREDFDALVAAVEEVGAEVRAEQLAEVG